MVKRDRQASQRRRHANLSERYRADVVCNTGIESSQKEGGARRKESYIECYGLGYLCYSLAYDFACNQEHYCEGAHTWNFFESRFESRE